MESPGKKEAGELEEERNRGARGREKSGILKKK